MKNKNCPICDQQLECWIDDTLKSEVYEYKCNYCEMFYSKEFGNNRKITIGNLKQYRLFPENPDRIRTLLDDEIDLLKNKDIEYPNYFEEKALGIYKIY